MSVKLSHARYVALSGCRELHVEKDSMSARSCFYTPCNGMLILQCYASFFCISTKA
jgi:hypothetical protein